MERKQFNKAFSKRHPLMGISACSIAAAAIENDIEEAIPKMFSEYERFLQIEDEEDHYSQAPLLALHDLYYRFYVK